MGRFVLITGLAFVLTGCASISEDQCRVGNWDALGFKDGSNGITASRVSNYADECSSYDISVDTQLYLKGHAQGVENYCTPQRGFDRGESGSSFKNLCSGFVGYEDGYEQGRIAYDIEQAHIALHKDYDAAIADYDEVKILLNGDELNVDERKELGKKLRRIERRLNRLESELETYESVHDLTCNY